MLNYMKKFCYNDNDCLNNEYCSFDPQTITNSCISKKDLKLGCLNNIEQLKELGDVKMISSYNIEDQVNEDSCINFSRKQKNKDGLYYNHFIYKRKKNTPIDINNIDINLSCDEVNNISLSNNDFFDIVCEENMETCKLKSNTLFKNFLKSNEKTCKTNKKINVNYSCENENVKNTDSFNIKDDTANIELSCPINKDDEKLKSKCTALYIENDNTNILDKIDVTYNNFNCLNPLYITPIEVGDISLYKDIKKNKLSKELNNYNNMIDTNSEGIRNIKIQKIITEYEYANGQVITFEQAKKILEYEEENNKNKLIESVENQGPDPTIIKQQLNILEEEYIDDLHKLTAIQKTNNNIINNKMNEINSNNELMTQKIYMDYYKTNVNNNLINFLKTVSLIVFIVFIVVIVYVNYSLKKST